MLKPFFKPLTNCPIKRLFLRKNGIWFKTPVFLFSLSCFLPFNRQCMDASIRIYDRQLWIKSNGANNYFKMSHKMPDYLDFRNEKRYILIPGLIIICVILSFDHQKSQILIFLLVNTIEWTSPTQNMIILKSFDFAGMQMGLVIIITKL